MRLYLPATLAELGDAVGLYPRSAHAVTRALAEVLPDEDLEGLEFAALLAAADASVGLLADNAAAPRRRVVAVADVPGTFEPVPGGLPSAVVPPAAVPWALVVSLHVDDADAAADVASAAQGDAAALDRAAERDLLWYDVSELDSLRP